jgi:hypothetical protein
MALSNRGQGITRHYSDVVGTPAMLVLFMSVYNDV